MLKFFLPLALLSQVTLAEKPADFISLFDGKTLEGWKGHSDHWTVEDEAIVGRTDGSLKKNSFIYWTEGEPKNFELQIKVRMTEKGNSGLQYRSQLRPDLGEWRLSGYQCDVVPRITKYNGMLYEEMGRRIIGLAGQEVAIDRFGIPWVNSSTEPEKATPGEWQQYRILAEGNHLRHWIDGRQTVNLIDGDPSGRSLQGMIAMQVHTGPAMKVEFRDIWLKKLADDLPLQEPSATKEATLVRPQQRLPKNWTPPVRGEFIQNFGEDTVTWNKLTRKGFEKSALLDVSDFEKANRFRVWIGGSKKPCKVIADGKVIFDEKRVSSTWQLLDLPISGAKKIELKGDKNLLWAEPSLWKVDR